ncbi:unnamed protein product [Protopolystoma xenopodis]|uniref:Uncharacterized protein n=1 Tax=Protopolystoma xenopodis TaxID=117903 RepID=A0A3S5C3E4_9PLAT|nr:unnamed protein product [Protopolystoma xenopodis]
MIDSSIIHQPGLVHLLQPLHADESAVLVSLGRRNGPWAVGPSTRRPSVPTVRPAQSAGGRPRTEGVVARRDRTWPQSVISRAHASTPPDLATGPASGAPGGADSTSSFLLPRSCDLSEAFNEPPTASKSRRRCSRAAFLTTDVQQLAHFDSQEERPFHCQFPVQPVCIRNEEGCLVNAVNWNFVFKPNDCSTTGISCRLLESSTFEFLPHTLSYEMTVLSAMSSQMVRRNPVANWFSSLLQVRPSLA